MAAAEVARLVARLEADVRDFDRDMKKAEKRLGSLEKKTDKSNKALKKSEGAFGGLTDQVKKFGAAVGIAFAGKVVLDFARDTIRAASDLNESINAVEVTFGDAADGIKRLGEEAADSVGLSNSAFNTLAVGFSAFVDKIDQGGGNVVNIMDDLTTRVADFASVMNLEVAEAGNIFRSALAGETEAIRRFGVDVSAVAVSAKAMALGLADSSAELTEQDKILARFNLIMEQTEKTTGDFANTQDDLANATRTLEANIEDAKAVIGAFVVQELAEWVGRANELIQLFQDLNELVGTSGDEAEESGAKQELFGNILQTTGFIVDRFLESAGRVLDFYKDGKVAAEDILGPVHRLSNEIDLQADSALRAANAGGELSASIAKLDAPNKDIGEGFKKIGREAETAAQKIKKVHDRIRELVDPTFAAVNAVEGWVAAQSELNELIEDGTASQGELNSAAQDVLNEYLDLLAAADQLDQVGLDNAIATLRVFGEQAGIDKGLIEGLVAALEEAAGFKGTAELTLRYVEEGVAARNRFLGLEPDTGSASIDIPDFVRSQIGIPGLAGGGSITAGSPAIVGEQGPELFVPNTSGQIIPNDQLGGNITLNVGEMTENMLDETIEELLGASLTLHAETR